MNKKELIKKLENIEWNQFEVKSCHDKLSKDVWETVSAFANTNGGFIIFGVQQKGKDFKLVGLNNPEKIESDFLQTLNNSSKFPKKITVKEYKYEVEGKQLLGFKIEEAELSDKPIYFGNPKNTFIRTGSGDQRATKEEIDAMYRNSAHSNKDKELTEYGIEAIDKETLKKFRRYFSEMNPEHRFVSLDNYQFLNKFNFIQDNKLTYAGLLFIGNIDYIEQIFPGFRIDYIEIPGTSYDDAPTRYTFRFQEGDNIFNLYFDIINRLKKVIDIPFELDKDNITRKDNPPHYLALREALANLIMNTDYFSKTTPRVRVFKNRIEFMNPGCLPKKLELILKEDYTSPRNKVIAKCLRYLNIAEEMGSGFHKMIDGWNNYYENQPNFSSDYSYFKVEFYFDEKVMSPVVKKSESVEKNEKSIDIIEYISEHVPSVSPVCPQLISKQKLKQIVDILIEKEEVSPKDLRELMGENNRNRFRKNYVSPLIEIGFIKLKYPDKPTSSKQKYLLSDKIKDLLSRKPD